MKRELAIEFSRVTEAAALAGYKWLGRGDKNAADGAAVHAMRIMLNKVDIDGRIVIGEGEIDEAPMLYIGEQVGSGQGDAVDIAVDPIEGTRMTAMGQSNALAVLAVGDRGTFLHAPDMYMEKLVVGPAARGAIDLNLPLAENLRNVAARLTAAEWACGIRIPRRRGGLHSHLHAGKRGRCDVRHRRRAGRGDLSRSDPRAGRRHAGAFAAAP